MAYTDEELRYELTLKAREIARANFARKSVAEDRATHYSELVRSPEFLEYIKGLHMGEPTPEPTTTTGTMSIEELLAPKKEVQQVEEEVIEEQMNKSIRKQAGNHETQFGTINFDQYKPYKWGSYVELEDERVDLLKQFTMDIPYPFLIEGDKGLGKTLCVYDVAYDTQTHLVFHACSSGTREGDLLGRSQVDENGSYFDLGVLPRAILCANKFKKACLYLDEVNALEPEMQKILNPVLDDRHMVVANNKLFKLDDGCKLVIISSMNPSYYAGVNQLTEDLRSRYIGSVWDYPSSKDLDKIINWEDIPDTVSAPLVQVVQDTHSSRVKGDVEYVLSPRDIVQFTNMYRVWLKDGLVGDQITRKCIKTCLLVKYGDATEREFIKNSIADTFGITL